jgi:hypothetical protein
MLAAVLVTLALQGSAANVSAGADQQQASITPSEVEATIVVGKSLNVNKTVQTPSIPALAHICFLADTTGSMGPVLANVQSNIGTIIGTIQAESPDAQFCASQYKDVGDVFVYNLDQALTTDATAVSTAVGTWVASGGGDTPECQAYALEQLAGDIKADPKPNATRFVVWFGDATGHDPCNGSTFASATTALQASGIKVIAIDVGNLNGDGQASALATATGGVYISTPDPEDVSDAILAGLTAVPIDVAMASDCTAPISTTFDPAAGYTDVASGSEQAFKETISVAPNATPGIYVCRDYATIDGVPMTDPTGAIIYETKTLTVIYPPIVKDPVLSNLWLCLPVPECALNSGSGIGQQSIPIVLGAHINTLEPKCTGETGPCLLQSIGSFEFEVRFDAKLVNVTVSAGPLFTAAEANVSCDDISGQGFVQFRCNVKGKDGEPITGPGVLAVVHITPTADVYHMVIASQENGIATQLINQECALGDLQGHPIPSSVCGDADVTLRYLEGDVNADCQVDVRDQQEVAFGWGSHTGQLLYNSRLDLEPSAPKLGDGDIDAKDIQMVYGRHGSTCSEPHPPQDPVNPKATTVPPPA